MMTVSKDDDDEETSVTGHLSIELQPGREVGEGVARDGEILEAEGRTRLAMAHFKYPSHGTLARGPFKTEWKSEPGAGLSLQATCTPAKVQRDGTGSIGAP